DAEMVLQHDGREAFEALHGLFDRRRVVRFESTEDKRVFDLTPSWAERSRRSQRGPGNLNTFRRGGETTLRLADQLRVAEGADRQLGGAAKLAARNPWSQNWRDVALQVGSRGAPRSDAEQHEIPHRKGRSV